AAAAHLDLGAARALVLASTGPVGRRVVQLLAGRGAEVRAASRSRQRAAEVCQSVAARLPSARLSAHASDSAEELQQATDGVDVIVAAGAAGVELMTAKVWESCPGLKVAIDLNAVPPAGLSGIEPTDRATGRHGVSCYGAIGVGGVKMKIHKAAIRRLFESNDQVLDAEEILHIGQSLQRSP
ncbi:MAG: NAD(P)H-binding protein, partial [Pirellulales bacterium]|nr:NAD(P)H-binding protein [Pirellulales bacterium]